MKRRTAWLLAACLTLAGLCALCLPPEAAAEKTVGVIMTGDIAYYQKIHEAFSSALSGKGDIKIVLQTPAPEPMAWANSARKLVTIGADVIVSYGAPATLSAMKATSTIPIIFAGVYDPAEMDIAGKNATGISSKVSIDTVLRNLVSISEIKKLGVIFNKTEKDTILQVREVKGYEASMGFKMVLFDAGQRGFAGSMEGVDALLLTTSCGAMCSVDDIIVAARKGGVPTASTIGGAEEKGIILTLAANPEEQGRAIADIVLKVAGGQAPSAIPVKAPSKIDFTVNLREAESLGLRMPAGLLSSATRVIR